MAVVLDGKCSPCAERIVKQKTQRASGEYIVILCLFFFIRRKSGGEFVVVYYDGNGDPKGEVCTAFHGSPSASFRIAKR